MPTATRVVENVELGKAFIVKYLRELMTSKGIDTEPMLFIWEHDRVDARWILIVYSGRSKSKLRFMERDIVRWPWSKAVVTGSYDRSIRGLVESVRTA